METKYPYYVPTRMDGGVLHKICGDRKFKSFQEAFDTVIYKYEHLSGHYHGRDHLADEQIVFLEYIGTFKSNIIGILNHGKDNLIFMGIPKKLARD